MRSHRLNRLTLLTQGIALIGFGMSDLACADKPMVNGPEQPHVNAMPTPTPSASAVTPDAPPTSPSSSASGTLPKPPTPIHTNAPPSSK